MSLWTPPPAFLGYQTNLTNPAATIGTSVPAPGTANTKSAYVQLIASTDFDCYLLEIAFLGVNSSAADTGTLVDIAIGAAASEVVVINNLNAGFAGPGNIAGQKYQFPLFIPAGSRIAARSQSARVSGSCYVILRIHGRPTGPAWAGRTVTTYGASTAASEGVTVISGVSAAEGSWTEIVASTTSAHSWLTAGLALLDADKTATDLYLDIAVGAAASEVVISENNHYLVAAAEYVIQSMPIQIWRPIPSGVRLAARISHVTATAESYDVCLYGVS